MNANNNHSAANLIRQILADNARALDRYLRQNAESMTLEQIDNVKRLHDETATALRAATAQVLGRDPREVDLSWSVQGTGGGCDGLMADWGTEGGYCLITAADDPSAPESPDEEVGLGIYTADGEPLYYGTHPNTATAQAYAAEWLDNANNGGMS